MDACGSLPSSDAATPPLTCSSGSSSPALSSPNLFSSGSGYESDVFVRRSSHTRKKDPNHVKRPSNAFIIYRSSVTHEIKTTSDEHDHRNISRTAAMLWRNLSNEEREPYLAEAARQKAEHAAKYPDYKYAPVSKRTVKKRKSKRDTKKEEAHCAEIAHKVSSVLRMRKKGPDTKLSLRPVTPPPPAPQLTKLESPPLFTITPSTPELPALAMPSPSPAKYSPYTPEHHLSAISHMPQYSPMPQPESTIFTPELCPSTSTASDYQTDPNLPSMNLPDTYDCPPQVCMPSVLPDSMNSQPSV